MNDDVSSSTNRTDVQELPLIQAGGPAELRAGPVEEEHGHVCACGVVDGAEYPELDARQIPHAIRHATIFGALDAVGRGDGLILVAPHDPLPLLAQLEERSPATFDVSYLDRGPTDWRLAIVRRSTV